MKTAIRILGALLLLAGVCFAQQLPAVSGNPSYISRPGGKFYAPAFFWQGRILSGNSATGTGTIILAGSAGGGIGGLTLFDGSTLPLQVVFNVLTPLIFDWGQANAEYVTPTAVSVGTCPSGNLGVGGGVQCAYVTGSFTNLHGASGVVVDGSYGVQTAINYAQSLGGGVVVVDPAWAQLATTTGPLNEPASASAILQGLIPYWNVNIEDDRVGPPIFWNVTQAVATVFSAPALLASGTVASSSTVAGSASYAGGTIHVCYALVDVMGNEGPCSADYSFADTSAKAIVFQAPPAATGAVGYIPYIGIESAAATDEYQVLLYTQPTVIGSAPVSNGVCTLTTVETITPACAIANATYNQTGSIATVAGYPVITQPQAVGVGAVGTASYLIGNSNGRTSYKYQPGANIGTAGLAKNSFLFTTTTAAGSAIPQGLATLAIPSGFMNYVGRTIRICGLAYSSTQGASSIVAINFMWDAQGSDVTTGLPVLLGGPLLTNTLTTGTVADFSFCQDLTTTVASASATGGSILAGNGYLVESALTTGATGYAGPSNQNSAAVGSLNLAGPARIQIFMKQTTSTTAVPQLFNLTVQVLN